MNMFLHGVDSVRIEWGEDAQVWVSRTRHEGDEHRESFLPRE
ncbi:hypothetical protein [Plectonema radiosum]|nr:hypothetical protein [Plectonema radiosum]